MLISNIGELIKKSPYKRDYIRGYMNNISANTLSNWCTGKTHPSAEELFRLSRFLGVTVEDLYEYKEDEE
jgi:putative transcriptional regulator